MPLWSETKAFGSGDPEEISARRALILTLVEKFGGEVVFSTLGWHLSELVRSQALGSDRWLEGMLVALEHCGALTLDAVDETEVIVRLSPNGAALLYDLPAARSVVRPE